MGKRGSYHHGDLRAALVEAALALIAERGIDALSVAEAARRTGVSPGAPYRHFPTRLALLKAAATRAAELLAAELREAPRPAGDPVEALAATAAVYVRFVVRHHAGFDLIFAEQLRPLADPALGAAGRAVMDVLLPLGLEITGDAAAALDLLEKHIAAAHGYAALHLSGFMRRRAPGVEDIAAGAAETSRTLAKAAQH
ncbi:TetR/AcrR family transcriptional regulator [Amycolatopsis acidiphila]|uniref:TetR/AcrR family transcriptional regulator n=1 Tax=Amycolatopsis acidiphila TaxID=715473 RepID=A0A558A9B1_9PSEU|nr:TetR/AcrR family transcriptional regulator [Amycolatopsis acidiphila]TVT20843.1 TetR/AcrR family transcriptional regulator [Amycolatopsis acidiphila]UIJ58389.1 TetR/AcrR family transcriptional regulator [Amycolatopsis acidiphila]